jgi:hypothetical protein
VAAWRAASVAKSAAKDASKIAEAQTNVSMTAAKANALASRIDFYTQKLRSLRDQIQDGKVTVTLSFTYWTKLRSLKCSRIIWLGGLTDKWTS